MSSLAGSRVLVTGAGGMLGRALVPVLTELVGPDGRVFGHTRLSRGTAGDLYGDLTDIGHVTDLFNLHGPFEYVFHLAGWNGGISWNARYGAAIFYRNTVMGLNLLDACAKHRVKKVLAVLASCAYPADVTEYFGGTYRRELCPENELLDGPPHPSVACHAYAKRNLQIAAGQYRRQYGLPAVCAVLPTLYGPGDTYDPERTKVVGALVKKFADATDCQQERVVVWGSGKPLREILYVADAARLLAWAVDVYGDSDIPLNLGSGVELSVADLAHEVALAAGYTGEIAFDTSKPDGQFRKRLDTSRMTALFGPFTPTPLPQALGQTVAWYRSHRAEVRP